MKNLFLPYDIALKLKEVGFNENCFAYYAKHHKFKLHYFDRPHAFWTKNSEDKMFTNFFKPKDKIYNCTAPFYQQVVDWFREKYGVNIVVDSMIGSRNYQSFGRAVTEDGFEIFGSPKIFYTGNDYYEALNKAIEESIKLIKK